MSNYREAAYHPVERVVRTALWLDDYFGRHQYGVRFDEGGPVFHPREVAIPCDVVFVPRPEPAPAKVWDSWYPILQQFGGHSLYIGGGNTLEGLAEANNPGKQIVHIRITPRPGQEALVEIVKEQDDG